MVNYNLCYYYNKEFIRIEYEKLFNTKNRSLLESIDNFTMQFSNKESLRNYLYKNSLINSKDVSFYLCRQIKGKNVPIYNKTVLFYKEDKEYVNDKYIYKYVLSKENDYVFINRLMKSFEKKYSNVKGLTTVKGFINYLISTTKLLINNKEEFDLNEIDEYYEQLNNFLLFELYKTDIKNGVIELKYDANGEKIVKYKELHDFVNILKSIGAINIKTIELTNDEEMEFEEFLTPDDFYKINHFLAEGSDNEEELYDMLQSDAEMRLCKHFN